MTGSTLIIEVADAIEARLATLSVDGDPIKAYSYDPGYEGMSVPAASIFIPDLERPALHAGESQMGTDDWDFTFELNLYVDLVDAQRSQRQIAVLLADAILAFDGEPTLGGLVLEAAITSAESGSIHLENRARPLLNYECELSVRRLVDTLYP